MSFFKNRKTKTFSQIYLCSNIYSIKNEAFLIRSQLLRCPNKKIRIVMQSTVENTILTSRSAFLSLPRRGKGGGEETKDGLASQFLPPLPRKAGRPAKGPNNKIFNKNRGLINDSISDMLTRVRNACLAKKATVIIPYTHPNHEIAQILEKEGFIQNFQVSLEAKDLILRLKYRSTQIYKGKTKECCITNLRRISKPGLRIYSNFREIPRILGGTGIVIISTPKGIMTDREARLQGMGGELLCSVW